MLGRVDALESDFDRLVAGEHANGIAVEDGDAAAAQSVAGAET